MYQKHFKRVFDLIGALLILPLFIIIYIPVASIIWIEDRGTIFYNANRLGKNGYIFKMYKFRSMKMNCADIRNEDGSTYNGEDDPRLTKVGKIIRKMSIDELPQLINIIKGDMSFIGPRPDLPGAIDDYIDEEVKKLNVRPGITGYNQAYFRNSVSQGQKFFNDVYYVENISLAFDIKILFKTIETVLMRKNIFVEESKERNKSTV